jgi:tetratricopeptide (TPR) repeat protein
MQWIPSEVALWKQAAARNHWDTKDREMALELSSQALNWDADNPSLLTERADWLAELGRYNEAIDIYQMLIANLITTGESALTIQLRMQLCNHLNSRSMHDKQPSDETWQQWVIINTWYETDDRIRQLSLLKEANLHNNQAYQLAVSNSHLKEALASASKCLELLGERSTSSTATRCTMFKQRIRHIVRRITQPR